MVNGIRMFSDMIPKKGTGLGWPRKMKYLYKSLLRTERKLGKSERVSFFFFEKRIFGSNSTHFRYYSI